MKKLVLNSSILLMALSVSPLSFADKMDLDRPNDSGAGTPIHAKRDSGLHSDRGRMNSELLEDELELGQAFTDQELLAELDLEDLETFDYPYDDGLLDDKS